MPSNLGGMQLHYLLTSEKEDFEYTFDAPVGGKYALSARVVTPSWDQQLQVAVNGSEDPINIELPYTVGMYGVSPFGLIISCPLAAGKTDTKRMSR